ncbi:hypothetical protein ACE0DR_01090 [Azotobacter sp. CWF10]
MKTLGQIEVFFTLLLSHHWLKEQVSHRENSGCCSSSSAPCWSSCRRCRPEPRPAAAIGAGSRRRGAGDQGGEPKSTGENENPARWPGLLDRVEPLAAPAPIQE